MIDAKTKEQLLGIFKDLQVRERYLRERINTPEPVQFARYEAAMVWDMDSATTAQERHEIRTKREEEKQRILDALTHADQWFAEGYRVRYTLRRSRGIEIAVPDKALIFEDQVAGYVAMSEQHHIAYLVRKV